MTRFRFRPALAAGALALALALGFQVGGAFSSSDDTQQAAKVEEAFQVIADSYVDAVDSAHLAESAIEGMLADLDPHSIYISADEMRAVRESFNASFDGIGIYYEFVEGEADQDTLVVLMPIAGGPSEEAGSKRETASSRSTTPRRSVSTRNSSSGISRDRAGPASTSSSSALASVIR